MINRVTDYLPAQRAEAPTGESSWWQSPQVREWLDTAERSIVKHPGPSLAIAFLTGVAIAWWIKRR